MNLLELKTASGTSIKMWDKYKNLHIAVIDFVIQAFGCKINITFYIAYANVTLVTHVRMFANEM